MQIVSFRDNLNEMSKPIFLERYEEVFQPYSNWVNCLKPSQCKQCPANVQK